MIFEQLKEIIRYDEPLKNHTSFRCGGPARFFAEPRSIAEIQQLLDFAGKEEMRVYILGSGSNVLFPDEGFDGMIIHIGQRMSDISVTDEGDTCLVEALAGCPMVSFSMRCAAESLEGAEFMGGIPGTVGGGVYMNAGAYGNEIRDIAVSAGYLLDGQLHEIPAEEMELGYRKSIFENMDGAVITSFRARLTKGDRSEIEARMVDYRARRTASQPLEVPSAGSTFKRPAGHYAGALIEASGLKGFALDASGAQVSPKHAGFVVNNKGMASSSDVLRLIDYVIQKVYEDSGVRLEPEVRIVK